MQPTDNRNLPIQFCDNETTPEGEAIPDVLLFIQRVWKDKATQYGDKGDHIMGAAFLFTYEGQAYIMPSMSPWQGCLSWEHFMSRIQYI